MKTIRYFIVWALEWLCRWPFDLWGCRLAHWSGLLEDRWHTGVWKKPDGGEG